MPTKIFKNQGEYLSYEDRRMHIALMSPYKRLFGHIVSKAKAIIEAMYLFLTKIRYAALATKIIKNQENILFRLEECAPRIGKPKQKKIGENGKGIYH